MNLYLPKKTLFFVFLSLILNIIALQAENCSNYNKCKCGCECQTGCNCGCGTGKPCNCHPPKQNKSQCPCNMIDCSCGCSEGKPCGCKKTTKLENPPCGNLECQCGCADGSECHCQDISKADPKFDKDCDEVDDCHDASPEYPWGPINPYEEDGYIARQCGLPGVWFPEDPPLFRPFVADPRQVTYSVGVRFNDQAIDKNVVDVSYGDSLGMYRWFNVWPFNGDLQIDVEGALWAVFAPFRKSAPLVNADYYVGIPITYAFGCWSFRLRGFHISSHIGDEWLIDHPGFDRRNPSAEYLDFFVSYELTDEIRVYDGIGCIVAQDDSFPMGRFYVEAGLELRMRRLGFTDDCNQLYGEPFYGMHFRHRRDFKHHLDSTYVLGYELGKLDGLRRKIRIYMEYHDGYSLEGQFARCATNYFAIRASYGF